MELLKPQRMVSFENMRLVVPDNATHLAIDCHGDITAHGSEPWSEVDFWEGMDELGIVGRVDADYGSRWMNSKAPFYIGDQDYRPEN